MLDALMLCGDGKDAFMTDDARNEYVEVGIDYKWRSFEIKRARIRRPETGPRRTSQGIFTGPVIRYHLLRKNQAAPKEWVQ